MAVELPGVKADQVEITFEDGLLTIQGERHFAHDSAEEKMHRAERLYGAFRRSITLPSHVEADKIEASTQDGVLQIMVPKAPDVQAKRIQVRAGQASHRPHAKRDGSGRQLTADPDAAAPRPGPGPGRVRVREQVPPGVIAQHGGDGRRRAEQPTAVANDPPSRHGKGNKLHRAGLTAAH